MNVIVQSKTLTVTEALHAFAVKEASRLFGRGHRISQVVIFLENIRRKKNDLQSSKAKFFVDLPGKNIVVQESAHDLYLAISEAAKKTVRQVRKMKERRRTKHLPRVVIT